MHNLPIHHRKTPITLETKHKPLHRTKQIQHHPPKANYSAYPTSMLQHSHSAPAVCLQTADVTAST